MLRCLWQQKRQNIAAKKSFDLKSNRRYFDLKSHLDRHWKDHLKNDRRSDQDHRLKLDRRSDQDHPFKKMIEDQDQIIYHFLPPKKLPSKRGFLRVIF
jgi:hypothetical protein